MCWSNYNHFALKGVEFNEQLIKELKQKGSKLIVSPYYLLAMLLYFSRQYKFFLGNDYLLIAKNQWKST